jgi:hypothetical protein
MIHSQNFAQHFWGEAINTVEASDAEMSGIVVHETKELDILVLDDKEPNTMESETGPQV